jgi:hypothetical protein
MLLRRASITMVLRFTFWDIMSMVSASGLYLGMGSHGGIGIIGVGGDGGGVCGFGGLPGRLHHYGNGDPPPAISTTTTEVIDFSIEFRFAILNYVAL